MNHRNRSSRMSARMFALIWAASTATTLGCEENASVAPDDTAYGSASSRTASLEPDLLELLPLQQQATFTTVFTAPLATEGLTADRAGNLYSAGRGGNPCPVWRVPSAGGPAVVVGNIPSPCSPNGLAFDESGALYVTDGGDKIYKLIPNETTPPVGALFAAGVPGGNGVAFDRRGNLWVTDGGTSQGRVFSVDPAGVVTERFRVQPLANVVNVVTTTPDGGTPTDTGGVGRDPRALPPGTLAITPTSRTANNTAGSVAIVANGIAFTPHGTLLISDTARGVIWRVEIDGAGNVRSSMGCDTTFSPNTLCLENVFVAHPALEGLDGIALDTAGNIWGLANERNAIVFVTRFGGVYQLFRNPVDAVSQLRNAGPLEFPTSPFLVDRKLCIAQTDVARRDNFPNSAGEVGSGVATVAKISCLDQPLPRRGLPLPFGSRAP